MILPQVGSLVGQIFVGWSSDRVGERRLHAAVPIYLGAAALGATALLEAPPLWLAILLFIVAVMGLKASAKVSSQPSRARAGGDAGARNRELLGARGNGTVERHGPGSGSRLTFPVTSPIFVSGGEHMSRHSTLRPTIAQQLRRAGATRRDSSCARATPGWLAP